MKQYGVLAVLAAILIGLAIPAMSAPLTLADLNADTDAAVQLDDLGSGMWELSFIANTELWGVTLGIADKANVFNVNFLGQANNAFSFTYDWSDPHDPRDFPSLVISAFSGTRSAPPFLQPGVENLLPFAANMAHTIASFQYANGRPRLDNTGVQAAFGPLLLEPDRTGIDLARVEFRGGMPPESVPEPSAMVLMCLGLAGLVLLRRWSL